MLHNWLALHREPGFGPLKFQQWLQTEPELANLPAWVKPNWQEVELDLAWKQQSDCHILTLHDPRYPKLLAQIADPPAVLFVQGDVDALNDRCLAMVGSRSAGSRGLTIAYDFAQHFASLGLVVTSGLALGIDAACHSGALAATNGRTLAVLGRGLDQIYPPQNKTLAEQIIASGALISEYPLGTPPLRHHFPRRNRIISGLCMGVLVVEARLKSGALITAALANDQGREVFAIPSTIDNLKSKGCHYLIKQGAKLVESAEDILEELDTSLPAKIIQPYTQPLNKVKICSTANLPADWIALLSYIDSAMTTTDQIIIQSGKLTQDVISILLQLELQGHIQAVPGGYVRAPDKLVEYNN